MATPHGCIVASMSTIAIVGAALFYFCAGLPGLFAFIIVLAGIPKKWFKLIYIVFKTLPRDLRLAVRFIKVNLMLYKWGKKKMSVPKLWSIRMKKHPNKVAYYFEDQQWTYAQIEELSNRVANYFLKNGYKKGDAVSLFMESCIEYICIWLGLSKIGVVTALINSNQRKNPLTHSITVAHSKSVIYASNLKDAIKEVRGDLGTIDLYQFNVTENGELLEKAIDLKTALTTASTEEPTEQIKNINISDKLIYVYTSGTTGLPKASNISNMRFMFITAATYNILDMNQKDIIYDPLPLYHSAGGIVGVSQALVFGIPAVIRRKFSASNYFKDCAKYNCTVGQYIGELCRYLLVVPTRDPSEKTHKLRLMFGNGLRSQIWKPFVERFNIKEICEFYGATEGNSNIANIDGRVGAVGFKPRWIGNSIYPIALIKFDEVTGAPIRDKNGLCIKCEPDEQGLFVGKIDPKKAISNFEGYTDQSATQKKILKDVFKKGDCYFNSGDILVMDELGYFYFKDRTGDTFRWRGENVATSEIEAVISNVVQLQDAVVYGVQVPNCEGRCGMAAIVDPNISLDIQKLSEAFKHNLPSYARPLFLRVMKEVPLTGTFKLKKVDLQKESYDPNVIKDRLYFFDAKKDTFVPLDISLYEDIHSGKIRL